MLSPQFSIDSSHVSQIQLLPISPLHLFSLTHFPFFPSLKMQQAIPYKSWALHHTTTRAPLMVSPATQSPSLKELSKGSNVADSVRENSIIVFARRGCCMSHVVKRLLLGVGVNPPIYEIDEGNEINVLKDLGSICNNGEVEDEKSVQLPAVFIGGKLFGGLDRVMATHISGDLVPILKEAGALWL